MVGEAYDKESPNVSKILPPSLQTPNNGIHQNSHDQVQNRQHEDDARLEPLQTNGIKKVDGFMYCITL